MTDEQLREEVARLRARVSELEEQLARRHPSTTTTEVLEVYEHWKRACRKPRAKLTADRRSKVRARMREGYSVADLRKAIDGAARHAFGSGVWRSTSVRVRPSARRRAMMSVAAPGPVGAMIRIGRFGHPWAVAPEVRARERQQAASR